MYDVVRVFRVKDALRGFDWHKENLLLSIKNKHNKFKTTNESMLILLVVIKQQTTQSKHRI